MHFILSIAWLLVGAAWVSAVLFMGHMVGGIEFLVHTGQGVPAAMNVLMAAVCLLAAICLLATKKVHISIIAVGAVAVLIHLINAFAIYLIYESNGGAFQTAPLLMRISAAIPTNTIFTERLVGNHVFFILPVGSAALLVLSFLLSMWRKALHSSGK